MNKSEIFNFIYKNIPDEYTPSPLLSLKDFKKTKFGRELKIFPSIEYNLDINLPSILKNNQIIITNKKTNFIKFYTVSNGYITRLGFTDGLISKSYIKHIQKKVKGKLSLFDDFVDFKNIKIKCIKIYKREEADIENIFISLKRKLKITEFKSKEYLKNLVKILDEMGNDCLDNIKKKKIYPYLIYFKKSRIIICSNKNLQKNKIIDVLHKKYPKIEKLDKLNIKRLDIIEYYFKTQLNILIDILYDEYNILNGGFISKYNYVKKKIDLDKLFMDVNRDLFIESMPDINHKFGFIYILRNKINDKKFVGISKVNMKTTLINIYKNKGITNKLYEDLQCYPFIDFSLEIYKIINSKKLNIQEEAGKVIERYKTYKNGYNN